MVQAGVVRHGTAFKQFVNAARPAVTNVAVKSPPPPPLNSLPFHLANSITGATAAAVNSRPAPPPPPPGRPPPHIVTAHNLNAHVSQQVAQPRAQPPQHQPSSVPNSSSIPQNNAQSNNAPRAKVVTTAKKQVATPTPTPAPFGNAKAPATPKTYFALDKDKDAARNAFALEYDKARMLLKSLADWEGHECQLASSQKGGQALIDLSAHFSQNPNSPVLSQALSSLLNSPAVVAGWIELLKHVPEQAAEKAFHDMFLIAGRPAAGPELFQPLSKQENVNLLNMVLRAGLGLEWPARKAWTLRLCPAVEEKLETYNFPKYSINHLILLIKINAFYH